MLPQKDTRTCTASVTEVGSQRRHFDLRYGAYRLCILSFVYFQSPLPFIHATPMLVYDCHHEETHLKWLASLFKVSN